jgi:antitoxin PrlF
MGFKVRKVIGSSKITRKFQLTIPSDVRKQYNFKMGDLVLFVEENGKLTITKNEL